MTRTDELLRVARIAVNTFQNEIDGPFVLPSGHKDVLIQRIYGVLLQVERECWNRALENARVDEDAGYIAILFPRDVAKLLRREHRAVVRMVKQIRKRMCFESAVTCRDPGHAATCGMILDQLTRRAR